MADRSAALLLVTLALALVVGCGSDRPPRPASGGWASTPSSEEPSGATIEDEDPPPPMVTATARPADAPAFEGTAGITEKKRPDAPQARLAAVRTGEHDGYDRVVFEFEGSALPGYHVEYVDKPVRRCGSGEPVVVAGDAWLLVRFQPAVAHKEKTGPKDKGGPTVKQQEQRLKMPVARELEQTCDFEGHVDWVIGVASPGRYRVLELSGPARVVVDVLHK